MPSALSRGNVHNRTSLTKLLLALLGVLIFQSTSEAQSSTPKTVLDYYQLLPEKYFEADKEKRVKWMLDASRGAVVDIKNGYIYAAGDGAQASLYIRLFKRPKGGTPLVAVKSHEPDTDEYTYIDFYELKNVALVEVKEKVLPVKVNKNLKYKLPRYGKSIDVSNSRGTKLYTLIWSGRRFVLKRF